MNLILLSPESFSEIPLAKQAFFVKELMEHGLGKFHLRNPFASQREICEFLDILGEENHSKVVLHGFESLDKKYQLGGFHYKKNSERITGTNYVSFSAHSFGEVETLNDPKGPSLDFSIFLSPIFDSISKKGYKQNFDFEVLKEFVPKHKNLVALGGCSISKTEFIQDLGFTSMALLGEVWENFENETYKEALFEVLERNV
ncbi:MAG: hypothetical protein C4K58_02700 [Flavobacteriaceae bacterium]|nr:MAG: hypothetical protein C4K58_02700 [Flavobacteriaceae bacterium]